MKSQSILNVEQKNLTRLEEVEDHHDRVNLNDLISRKKEEERASRKTSILVYSFGICCALLVLLIYQFIK